MYYISHTCLNAITLTATQENMEIQVNERNVTIEEDLNTNDFSYYYWQITYDIPTNSSQ